jgi:hypothetical protein
MYNVYTIHRRVYSDIDNNCCMESMQMCFYREEKEHVGMNDVLVTSSGGRGEAR